MSYLSPQADHRRQKLVIAISAFVIAIIVAVAVVDWWLEKRAQGPTDAWLTALDAETGEEIWQERLPGPYHTLVGVRDGVVAVDETNRVRRSFDAVTGEPLGESDPTAPGAEILPEHRYDAERVYYAVGGSIKAYNRDGGTEAWSFPVGSGALAAPVVVDGTVVAQDRTSMYGLDAATGESQWTQELPERRPVRLLTDGEYLWSVAALASSADIAEHDVRTGRALWSMTISRPEPYFRPAPEPATGDGMIFPYHNGFLEGRRAGDGEVLWKAPLETKGTLQLAGYSVVEDGTLYTATMIFPTRNHVTARDTHTGEVLWQVEVPIEENDALLIADGGTVYALSYGKPEPYND